MLGCTLPAEADYAFLPADHLVGRLIQGQIINRFFRGQTGLTSSTAARLAVRWLLLRLPRLIGISVTATAGLRRRPAVPTTIARLRRAVIASVRGTTVALRGDVVALRGTVVVVVAGSRGAGIATLAIICALWRDVARRLILRGWGWPRRGGVASRRWRGRHGMCPCRHWRVCSCVDVEPVFLCLDLKIERAMASIFLLTMFCSWNLDEDLWRLSR